MSFELINDLVEAIKTSPKSEFASILQEVIDNSFIEDVELCKLFKIEMEDLEELVEDSSSLTKEEWSFMAGKLVTRLKREIRAYQALYYRD
jgi:hypothetical protein